MSLSAQLLDCKHFRWQPGMLGFSPSEKRYQRCAEAGAQVWVWMDSATGHGRLTPYPDLVPVLTDAPTRGALLEQIQRAWCAPNAYVKMDMLRGTFFVGGLPRMTVIRGEHPQTAGEVLAKALLEAP